MRTRERGGILAWAVYGRDCDGSEQPRTAVRTSKLDKEAWGTRAAAGAAGRRSVKRGRWKVCGGGDGARNLRACQMVSVVNGMDGARMMVLRVVVTGGNG